VNIKNCNFRVWGFSGIKEKEKDEHKQTPDDIQKYSKTWIIESKFHVAASQGANKNECSHKNWEFFK
jgi:hypothetical protein